MLANTLLNKITLSEKKSIIESNEIFLYSNMTTAKRFFAYRKVRNVLFMKKLKKNLQTTLKWPLIVFIDF